MPREISIIRETSSRYLIRTEKTVYNGTICYKKSEIEISGFGLYQCYDIRDGYLSPFIKNENLTSEDLLMIATILAEASVEDELV